MTRFPRHASRPSSSRHRAAVVATALTLAAASGAGAERPVSQIPRVPSPIVVVESISTPPGAVAVQIDEVSLAEIAEVASSGVVIEGVPFAPGVTRDLFVRRLDPDLAPQIDVVEELDPGVTAVNTLSPDEARSAVGVVLVGSALGAPDSRAILSIGPAGLFGALSEADARFLISSGPYGKGHPPLAFDPLKVPPDMLEQLLWICDAPPKDDSAGAMAEGGAAGTPPCRQLHVAVETDHEYLKLFAGNELAAANYAIALVAASSEILTADANARLGLVYLRLWKTASDPWTAPTPYTQLVEFRSHWNLFMASVSRDVAHFLSGRPLGGGSAWTATVCGLNAFSLSSNLNGFFPYPLVDHDPQNWDIVVVSHELGHNLGAIHTHQHGVNSPDSCFFGDCSSAWGATIMSYCYLCPGGIANLVLEYAQVSIDEILNKLGAVGCDYSWPVATPVAVADWAEAVEGASVIVPVLANDEPANCGPVMLVGISNPSALGGSIELGPDPGTVRYTAPEIGAGIDSFAYTIVGEGVQVGLGQVSIVLLPMTADLDGDGGVNGSDLGLLLGLWESADAAADLDGSGVVDGSDLGILLGYWTG
ncbi:MAG: hypothetical protein FJ253_03500 [Phycisphaerae bacterium]|nr:hypothetical protein [Phycisphaerae bacterium]